jgi:hypothetical protein
MKQFVKLLLGSLACITLFGCAHPITMNPDLASVQAKGGPLIDKQVGFYIADASKALEVTTPGGGGDKIRYFPYRDMEPGIYKALTEVFRGVSKVKDPKDLEGMRTSGISLLIVPDITTTSASPSPFTWPPTEFTVTLACMVTDGQGKPVRNFSVTGSGKAEFDEFKSNFSLAAVRAANDALSRLVTALGEAPELRK